MQKENGKIKNTIIALRPSDIYILFKTLSNYNSLNYYLEKIKILYNPYCDYFTDLLNGNSNWELECLETASHILLDCTQFLELRESIFYKPKLPPNYLSKIKGNAIQKIIEFMKKSKVYEREPKLNRRDLSPNRNIKDTRKRSGKEIETEKRPKKAKIHQTSILDFRKIN